MTEITLGARLKKERERLGYTQPEFAALVGASKRSQIGWEQGRTSPDVSAIAVWAEFGLDVLYVVTGRRSVLPVQASGTAVQGGRLQPDEEILLDNYRNSPPDAQAAIKAASNAFSKKPRTKSA